MTEIQPTQNFAPATTYYDQIQHNDVAELEAQVAAEWQVGDVVLDLYEVKEIITGGGMGLVYRVHHRGWNMDLAVKVPRTGSLTRMGGREAFIREAETWVNLGLHPHIVSCYYVRTLGGLPRVFAEFIEGGSLEQWITDRRLYGGGLERMLDIAIQFAWGLGYAHERGLVHQDIKPANVMMTPDGTAKVTDFGLTQTMIAGTDAVNWAGRTPQYQSPEQAEGKPLTIQSDMWSWGVSLLEMFSGELTWRAGQAAPELLESYRNTGSTPSGIPPMPEGVAALLEECFRREPAERPESMKVIAGRLRDIYDQMIGQPYPRPEIQGAELLADDLNNRAISLLDLGKEDDARSKWKSALLIDQGHLQTVFNMGLLDWRQAKIPDDALFLKVKEVGSANEKSKWLSKYFFTLLHLERGDYKSAIQILETLPEDCLKHHEIKQVFEQVHVLLPFSSTNLEGWTPTFVNAGYLSTTGHLILFGTTLGTICLKDVATGKLYNLFDITKVRHTNQVTSVCLSKDSNLALSGSRDETLRLWQIGEYKSLLVFEGHTDGVTSVCLSTDGYFALSGSEDNTLRLWEVMTGKCIRTFTGHKNIVTSVYLNADGSFALSGSFDNTLRLWEVATGKCIRIFTAHKSWVTSVCLSRDGFFALSGSADKTVRLWEVTTGRCIRTFTDHTSQVNSVCLSANGHLALSCSGEDLGKTLLSDIPTQFEFFAPWAYCRISTTFEIIELQKIFSEEICNARKALSEGYYPQAVDHLRHARSLKGYERSHEALQLWQQISTRLYKHTLVRSWCQFIFEGHTGPVNSVCLSNDNMFAISGSDDTTLRLWDITNGNCLRVFTGHTRKISSVYLSSDGRFALSGSYDHTMRLWDVNNGQCLYCFEGHLYPIHSVSLSADGQLALSRSEDRTVRLWDITTGKCLRTFEEKTTGQGRYVCLSADGRLALSGSYSGTLYLWEVGNENSILTLKGHTDLIHSVCLSPDCRYAASGSGEYHHSLSGKESDYSLRVWDIKNGVCLRTFKRHISCVKSVSLSTDSRFALSGCEDGTMRLWEVKTGECLRIFNGHTGSVDSVCLSVDCNFALSGSYDNTMRLWVLDWDLDTKDVSDWDESAYPLMINFLTTHSTGKTWLGRWKKPTWSEKDFQGLLHILGCAGYGWLRPERVRCELEKMAKDWQGPPSLSGYES